MLKSLYIENLFGLYSYHLPFDADGTSSIKFITAPNGYGKTTILNIIYSFYGEDFVALSKILFDKLSFEFSDGYKVKVYQKRIIPEVDIDNDIPQPVQVDMGIVMYGADKVLLLKKNFTIGETIPPMVSLHVYLSSNQRHYFRDNRLWSTSDKSEISKMVNSVLHVLMKLQGRLTRFFADALLSPTAGISKEDYYERMGKLASSLRILRLCHVLGTLDAGTYNENSKEYLNSVVSALENVCEGERLLIDKLKTFFDIINGAEFSHKQIQLSPSFGFRFIADNSDHTILTVDDLSSGEKQILIQTIGLLFEADDDSLVLIDEPELSFHMAWQAQFFENLKAIAKLKKIQCIISTHSPMIFQNHWNMANDLFDISTPSKYKPCQNL